MTTGFYIDLADHKPRALLEALNSLFYFQVGGHRAAPKIIVPVIQRFY
jgi:hypothetical protein